MWAMAAEFNIPAHLIGELTLREFYTGMAEIDRIAAEREKLKR